MTRMDALPRPAGRRFGAALAFTTATGLLATGLLVTGLSATGPADDTASASAVLCRDPGNRPDDGETANNMPTSFPLLECS